MCIRDRDNAEEGDVDVTPQPEMDPVTESVADLMADAIAAASRSGDSQPLDELSRLFGLDLAKDVSGKKPVKLDPTVDRSLFREQRDKLKSLGYEFQAMSQTWLLSERSS